MLRWPKWCRNRLYFIVIMTKENLSWFCLHFPLLGSVNYLYLVLLTVSLLPIPCPFPPSFSLLMLLCLTPTIMFFLRFVEGNRVSYFKLLLAERSMLSNLYFPTFWLSSSLGFVLIFETTIIMQVASSYCFTKLGSEKRDIKIWEW